MLWKSGFSSMYAIVRPLIPAFVNTLVVYTFLIALLRLAGRRQMGQLTGLDLLIILLLGSAVETALIGPSPAPTRALFHDPNTSLAAGLVSAGTLLLANRLFSMVLRRYRRLRHLVAGGPIILIHNGRLVVSHLRRAGMTEADLFEALREHGYAEIEQIRFAVLESNGEVHVVPMTARTHHGKLRPRSSR